MVKQTLFAAAALAATSLWAQDKPKPEVSRARQELLRPFLNAAHESLELAKAVPEEKYAWRPMEGVRSFGEVFVHMAGSTPSTWARRSPTRA